MDKRYSVIIISRSGEEKTIPVDKAIMDEEQFKVGDVVYLDGLLAIENFNLEEDCYSLEIIKECKNEFIRNSMEYFAEKISRKIFRIYEEKGEFPEVVSFLIGRNELLATLRILAFFVEIT